MQIPQPSTPRHRLVSTEELNELAEKAAEKAVEKISNEVVRKLLLTCGQDVSTPEGVIEMQKDFAFVRANRIGVAAMKSMGVKVVLGAIVTGIVAAVWAALKGPPA